MSLNNIFLPPVLLELYYDFFFSQLKLNSSNSFDRPHFGDLFELNKLISKIFKSQIHRECSPAEQIRLHG